LSAIRRHTSTKEMTAAGSPLFEDSCFSEQQHKRTALNDASLLCIRSRSAEKHEDGSGQHKATAGKEVRRHVHKRGITAAEALADRSTAGPMTCGLFYGHIHNEGFTGHSVTGLWSEQVCREA